MQWLKRFFAAQNRPFIVYVLIVAAILASRSIYESIVYRHGLARLASCVRRAFADKTEVTKLSMERSTLEFQLPGLRRNFPILTDHVLSNQWSAGVILSQLDPDVRESWQAYLGHVSPSALKADPSLGLFLTLQTGYDADVNRLALNHSLKDKPAGLMALRTNNFAPLFRDPVYLRDHQRFEAAAGQLTDEMTLALRRTYVTTLISTTTNRNPSLATYGRAMLEVETRSAEIRARIIQLNGRLRSLGELQEPHDGPLLGMPPPRAQGPPGNEGSFRGYIPRQRDFVIAELATALIGFLITLPAERRRRRWLKIGASMVLVYLGLLTLQVPVGLRLAERKESLFAFLAYLGPAVLLAAVWTWDICFLLSRVFMLLIDSPDPGDAGLDGLGAAYSAIRRNDFRHALQLIKPEFLQEHLHYEALLLKAKLHQRLDQKGRAKRTLTKITCLSNLNACQREHAAKLLRALENKPKA